MNKLILQLRAQRKSWVDLEPGKRVQIIRPAESEFPSFLTQVNGDRHVTASLDHVCKYVTDWEGFTEADFLGSAVGSSDPAAFDPDLWAEVVADRAQWMACVSSALIAAMVAHFEAKVEAAKN